MKRTMNLTTIIFLLVMVITVSGETRRLRYRTVTCRVTEINDQLPPEAQLVYQDTVLLIFRCGAKRVEIPAYQWPSELPLRVGKRVQLVVDADDRPSGVKHEKRVLSLRPRL